MSRRVTSFIFLAIVAFLSTATSNKWSLVDKNIIVTGGSKGIGKSIIKELLSLGAKVLTCGRDATELTQCLEEWGLGMTAEFLIVTTNADFIPISNPNSTPNFDPNSIPDPDPNSIPDPDHNLAPTISLSLDGYKDQIHAVTADVSTPEGRSALLSKCSELFGDDLHCLVNNVGSNIRKKAIDYSEEGEC
jgi:NAD(P)-dependent dehydrogenase (short-subunit alcohol dehydrogenase family)